MECWGFAVDFMTGECCAQPQVSKKLTKTTVLIILHTLCNSTLFICLPMLRKILETRRERGFHGNKYRNRIIELGYNFAGYLERVTNICLISLFDLMASASEY